MTDEVESGLDITLVAAVAENGVIGAGNALPWKLSSDLRRFKADTIGKPVVMGRKTFQSIGRPLPGRDNIIVTRDPGFRSEGADVVHTLRDAFALANVRGRCRGTDTICVIGGGQIYAQSFASASKLILTRVLGEFDGDTLFPQVDEREWRLEHHEPVPAGPRDSHATRYEVWQRRETGV